MEDCQLEIIDLSFEKWVEEYSPIINNIDSDAPFGGTLFGIGGEELENVVISHPSQIWTYRLDHLNNKIFVQGFIHENALGFFICQEKVRKEDAVTVHDVEKHE
jgi:hypothetical protein